VRNGSLFMSFVRVKGELCHCRVGFDAFPIRNTKTYNPYIQYEATTRTPDEGTPDEVWYLKIEL
jgi:hypothetical protein